MLQALHITPGRDLHTKGFSVPEPCIAGAVARQKNLLRIHIFLPVLRHSQQCRFAFHSANPASLLVFYDLGDKQSLDAVSEISYITKPGSNAPSGAAWVAAFSRQHVCYIRLENIYEMQVIDVQMLRHMMATLRAQGTGGTCAWLSVCPFYRSYTDPVEPWPDQLLACSGTVEAVWPGDCLKCVSISTIDPAWQSISVAHLCMLSSRQLSIVPYTEAVDLTATRCCPLLWALRVLAPQRLLDAVHVRIVNKTPATLIRLPCPPWLKSPWLLHHKLCCGCLRAAGLHTAVPGDQLKNGR